MKPNKRNDATNDELLFKDFTNGHARVLYLITSIVRYRRDKVCRLSNKTKSLCPRIIHWNLWRLWFRCRYQRAGFDEPIVNLFDFITKLEKVVGHVSTSILQSLILGTSSFHITSSQCTSMTKLNFKRKDGSTRSNAPSNQRLGDTPTLECFTDFIFIDSTHLSKENQYVNRRVVVVSQQMVNETRSRISISPNSYALVYAIRVLANDIVELVRHASAFGYICD
mmetsp:Transcript_12425/g.22570  ORF Transcript_12425/g.22570 Transcript_12425/m.22570 type:complete len:224 (-) Transcript_12425:523-1194(-)